MIIVEGCDNAGKTTLVHQLSDKLRLLTILNRRRPKSIVESWDYLIRVMPVVTAMPTIMDRFMAISEPIYGPICRKQLMYTETDIEGQMHFVQRSLNHQPLVIYCRPVLARILEFGDRAQMAGVVENAKAIVSEYDRRITWLRDKLSIPVALYDYACEQDFDRVLSSARAHLEDTYQ